jgi:hypothetical protein
MDYTNDDRYLVFVRIDPAHSDHPDASEVPLAECDSYAEARLIKTGSPKNNIVIRFAGSVGGGD